MAALNASSKVYIDLTTLARWKGTLTGIQRCQKIYAMHALDHVQNVCFTIYDPELLCYRHLGKAHAKRILEGSLRADMLVLPDINRHRVHFVDRLPRMLRPAFFWITKFRRRLIGTLEAIRYRDPLGKTGRWASLIEDRLIKSKERTYQFQSDGTRIDRPPFHALAGERVRLAPEDVVIAMQNDWAHTDIHAIAAQKRASGWRHVILCHDLIPILFPHWYDRPDVDGFISYYDQAFAIADRIIFTSNRTKIDAEDYCRDRNLPFAPSSVVPMGADFVRQAPTVALPENLQPGKYALFVSTIEPRKNHAMLAEAWRQMAQAGLIEKSGFKLVFAGMFGWHTKEFLQSIAKDPLLMNSIIHISGADDDMISRLYDDAAFCLYPPLYEGFGLPIVEALARGKALIVSSAGPMPEIAAGFALALDPDDTDGWSRAMGEWISNPQAAQHYADRARTDYRLVTWDEASRRFFEAALAPFANEDGQS